jgi:hypothetical protein
MPAIKVHKIKKATKRRKAIVRVLINLSERPPHEKKPGAFSSNLSLFEFTSRPPRSRSRLASVTKDAGEKSVLKQPDVRTPQESENIQLGRRERIAEIENLLLGSSTREFL